MAVKRRLLLLLYVCTYALYSLQLRILHQILSSYLAKWTDSCSSILPLTDCINLHYAPEPTWGYILLY